MIGTRLRAPVLVARQITRGFGAAGGIRGVDLSIRPGEVHALVGAPGAGKTTLLQILAGHLEPASGAVALLGQEVTEAHELRARVALVRPRAGCLRAAMSAEANLRHDGDDDPAAALDAVGLGEAGDAPVGAWSAGALARLAVARALMTGPDVLLVDDAARHLDAESARELRVVISWLAAGGTSVVWATRHRDEIHGFADRVTLLLHASSPHLQALP
jgi:ABC-type multidrug transport system ATPase subunit